MRASILLFATALALPVPAFAQHSGHEGHVGGTGAASATEQPAESAPAPADPHAGHQAVPPDRSGQHAGHDADASPAPPSAGPPAEAFSGPENAADATFGDTAMAQARREMTAMHGAVPTYRVLVDRLEAQLQEGADGYLLDAQAWYGGDIDKLWLKAEWEGAFDGDFDGLELQALWSHAIGPWFDLQAGVRHDLRDGPDRAHLALGVQGLAPYWIEVDAAAFLSDRGDLTATIEAEHDARVTQQLILQPRAELDLSAQDMPQDLIGAGISSASVGARLRYQFTPMFAPYVGIEYEESVGDTRDLRRAANEDLGGISVLVGIRTWF